jgi:hypothetical protein
LNVTGKDGTPFIPVLATFWEIETQTRIPRKPTFTICQSTKPHFLGIFTHHLSREFNFSFSIFCGINKALLWNCNMKHDTLPEGVAGPTKF